MNPPSKFDAVMLKSASHGNRQSRAFLEKGETMPKQMRRRGRNGLFYADFWMAGVRYQDKLADRSGRGTSDERWAERFLAELKSRIERGDYHKFKLTFADLCEPYLKAIEGRSPTIQERNRYAMAPLVEFFGSTRLASIRRLPSDDPDEISVVEYKERREALGRTESTIKKELRVFGEMMRLGDATWENPTAKDTDLMKAKNKGRKVERFLQDADVQAIVAEVPAKYRIPCLVSAYSGLRLNDVCGPGGLAPAEIGADGFIHRRQGKTGGYVKIPFRGNRKLQDALGRIPRPMDPATPFFADLDPRNASTAVRKAARRAGYPWASFRSFRHFAATQLLRCGVNLKTIQQFMGHKDFRSTLVYLHASDEDLMASAAAFDQDPATLCKLSAKGGGKMGKAPEGL